MNKMKLNISLDCASPMQLDTNTAEESFFTAIFIPDNQLASESGSVSFGENL